MRTRVPPRTVFAVDPRPAVPGSQRGAGRLTSVDTQEALPPGTLTKGPSFNRRMVRFAVMLAVIGCFVGMGWAFTLNKTPEIPLRTDVEGVEPAFGAAAVPGQTPVKVDLVFGYTGEISIDQNPLPKDEVQYEKAQAILSFSPGPGKSVSRFTNGIHVAQVVYWPLANPTDRKVFQWSFTVV